MANVAAGTIWNLPNYTGELFTSDLINTPFLSAIGGLTGGMQQLTLSLQQIHSMTKKQQHNQQLQKQHH